MRRSHPHRDPPPWAEHWHTHRHCQHEPLPRGAVRRVAWYVGERLHRKLFFWFAFAILAAGFAVVASWRFGPGAAAWSNEQSKFSAFVGGRFARVWDDPGARTELAGSIARELDLGVALRDPSGAIVDAHAMPEHCAFATRVPVVRDGRTLGRVEVCIDRHRHSPWSRRQTFAAIFVVTLLWVVAHRVARRITRPLREVTRVTRAIGEGDLAARTRFHHGMRGEVGELAEAINEMAARIERQLRDQRELLAAVSHELRTPLTRVRLLLELARDGDPGRDALSEIEAEAMEMDALVGELLAQARVDFGALSMRSLDAVEPARRAVDRAGLPPESLHAPDAPLEVRADPTLLARALAALLDNARKHGTGEVTLDVESDAVVVRFAVQDRGAGFAPGDETRVFEPFRRGSDAGGEARGLGLGLSLVKRIAEAHGGQVRAGNRLDGSGARVVFELPRVRASDSA